MFVCVFVFVFVCVCVHACMCTCMCVLELQWMKDVCMRVHTVSLLACALASAYVANIRSIAGAIMSSTPCRFGGTIPVPAPLSSHLYPSPFAADQVYGDQGMHSMTRNLCMDYMVWSCMCGVGVSGYGWVVLYLSSDECVWCVWVSLSVSG